jgi:acetyl esterase/lipase
MTPPLRLLLLLLAAAALRGAEPTVIPLWPEGVPGAQAGASPEVYQDDHYTNVQQPTLTWYPAPAGSGNGTAVVVCPGGGYRTLAWTKEGTKVAEWLNSLGVSAFVLKYRLKEYGHPAPLRDVLRALRTVRSRATEYGVNPAQLGVMGFSAGGHLASSAATLFDHPDGRTGAALDAVSARPDFAILVYPVIQMAPPFAHAGSREALLGKSPTPEQLALLSTDRQVTAQTPPVFLVHTVEDKTVPLENTLAFYQALRAAGVPGQLCVYEQGKHGYGLRGAPAPTSGWPDRCAEWLRSHGWVR